MFTRYVNAILGFLLVGNVVVGQMDIGDSAKNMYEMTLEDFLNVEVEVASQSAINTLEAPGILTVITEEEIKQTGARDLIDVFRLVPGLNFGMDVQNVVGMGARGNWGHEGKILILLDGQEMNEIWYATTQFGNHFDVNQIQKIEIIRGPGSSIYGGYAELGVINIITKSGNQINGVSATATYGQLSTATARQNASLSIGKKMGDFDLSIGAFFGQGIRTASDYTDMYGEEMNLTEASQLNPNNINIGMKYKGLELRLIHDNYQCTSSDWFDELYEDPFGIDFKTDIASLKYLWKINDKLSITPKVTYKIQESWATVDSVEVNNAQVITGRLTSNLAINYDLNDNISFTVGGESMNDHATDFSDFEDAVFSNQKKDITFFNMSAYVRTFIKTDYANLILGGRIDNHSAFGQAFSPRFGATKRFEKFHYKVLFSKAFRAPSIANINLNNDITPERTFVSEIEMGYKLNSKMLLTANVFDITINGPIVYFYDEDIDKEGYENHTQSGTRGVEFTYLYRDSWGFVNLNYSFYTAANKNEVEDYAVEGHESSLLGMPQHKINLYGSVTVAKGLSIGPSFTFLGERYAYSSVDDEEESVLETFSPSMLANLMINYNIKGFTVGVGAYDILNHAPAFLQPYNGYHSPMPSGGRELIVKLNYTFNFHKEVETISE